LFGGALRRPNFTKLLPRPTPDGSGIPQAGAPCLGLFSRCGGRGRAQRKREKSCTCAVGWASWTSGTPPGRSPADRACSLISLGQIGFVLQISVSCTVPLQFALHQPVPLGLQPTNISPHALERTISGTKSVEVVVGMAQLSSNPRRPAVRIAGRSNRACSLQVEFALGDSHRLAQGINLTRLRIDNLVASCRIVRTVPDPAWCAPPDRAGARLKHS